MQADTDLGELPVTTGVGPLAAAEVDRALDAGVARAEAMLARGLIVGVALFLAGGVRLVGLPRARISQPEPEAAIG
jgi:hypothetical protein